MVGSTTTNVTRVRGPQQVRLDMASEEETGWSAAEWPYSVDFDWWRAWAPATAASGKEPTIMLPAVNTTPGGSWAATLPPATDLSEGRAGIEQIVRSEEHTSELQSLLRISYAVFCLKKKTSQKAQ